MHRKHSMISRAEELELLAKELGADPNGKLELPIVPIRPGVPWRLKR